MVHKLSVSESQPTARSHYHDTTEDILDWTAVQGRGGMVPVPRRVGMEELPRSFSRKGTVYLHL
jgi:hypothetical protein